MSKQIKDFWDKLESNQVSEQPKENLDSERSSSSTEDMLTKNVLEQVEAEAQQKTKKFSLGDGKIAPPSTKLLTIFKLLEKIESSKISNLEVPKKLPTEFLEQVLQAEVSKKVEHEKRIRHQLYSELKYNLRLLADTQFYSGEAIRLIEGAKRLTVKYNYDEVTTEMFLLSFFFVESPALETIRKNCFTLESALNLYEESKLVEKQKILYYKIFQVKKIFEREKTILRIFKKLVEKKLFTALFLKYHNSLCEQNTFYRNSTSFLRFVFKKMKQFNENILEYSILLDKRFEILLESLLPKFYKRKLPESIEIPLSDPITELLNEALISAVERFQTPIITTDIILLTLIEKVLEDLGPVPSGELFEENFVSSPPPPASLLITKWFESVFHGDTKTELYLLRYELLMKIHKDESELKSQVPPEQHYFGYLLKTELPESTVQNLLENETFNSAVMEFRDNLMESSNKEDLQTRIYNDVLEKLLSNPERSYSSENTVE